MQLVERLRENRWTDAEDDLLRQYVETNTSFKAIAEKMPGRTRDACRARAHRIRAKMGKFRSWTREEDQFLKSEWSNLSAGMIGKRLGRPRNSVIGRIDRLIYGRKRHNVERAVRHRPTPEDIEARLAEIPDDTRDLTGRLMGDPCYERSALYRYRLDNGEAV